MTNLELMQQLIKYPAEAEVYVSVDEWDYFSPEMVVDGRGLSTEGVAFPVIHIGSINDSY